MAIAFPVSQIKPAQTAAETAAQDDPVVAAGLRIAELNRASNRIELAIRAENPSPSDKCRLESDSRHVYDMIEGIQAHTATMRATTLQGAMVHVMLADLAVSDIRDLIPEGTESLEGEIAYRKIIRCLHSVLKVLSDASGTAPEEIGGEYMMNRGLDPHTSIENRLASSREV